MNDMQLKFKDSNNKKYKFDDILKNVFYAKKLAE